MKNLVWDEDLRLYRKEQEKGFDYLDGGEDQILSYLQSIDDKSVFSDEVKRGATDWPSYYHFSVWRHNIMRPIKLGKEVNVLEVGAGCGAITRYMGETGANVVAVEGEVKRARSVRERCADLNNVTVCWANVFDIEFDRQFDILTLIGVFEYSGRYAPFDKPFHDSLRKYRNLLADDGKIVIAIENRMGLKYFCGYNEDHFGKPYLGLEDKYGERDVNTFGKKEIKELLEQAGFHDVTFFYPYPDYKFPQVILSESAVSSPELHTGDLISGLKAGSYSGVFRTTDMNYEMICKMVAQNGLEADLSNSFLIIASKKDAGNTQIVDDELLAMQFNFERKTPYHTVTEFLQKETEIIVKKKLATQLPTNNDLIAHNLSDSPYYIGRNLGALLQEAIFKNRPQLFDSLLSKWIDFLIENAAVKKEGVNLKSELIPDYYDAIPKNFIIDKKENLYYFDNEWQLRQKTDIGFLMYRGSIRVYKDTPFFKNNYGNFYSFFVKLCTKAGIEKPTKNQVEQWTSLDTKIKKELSSKPPKYRKINWYRIKIDIKNKLRLAYKMIKNRLDI